MDDASKSKAELIRELEQLRTSLGRAEEHYRALVTAHTDAVMIFDVDSGLCIGQSQAARDLFGYGDEEIRSLTRRVLHALSDAATAEHIDAEVHATGRSRHGRLRMRRKDGSEFWAEHSVTMYRASGRRLIVSVARDISESLEREEAVRRQKELLQTVFDNIPVLLVVFDELRGISLINRETRATLGWKLKEWQEVDVLSQCYPEREQYRHIVGFLNAALPVWKDFKTRTRDGRLIDVSWRGVKLSGGGLIAIGEDITERKAAEREVRELEAQLRQQQRLETIGTLAAGVAHEINNPLAFIIGNLEFVQEELAASLPYLPEELSTEFAGALHSALDGAERIQKIVRELKPLSRKQKETIGAVDVHAVVNAMIRMADHEIRHRAKLIREYGDVPQVYGDESRLAQVFLNLLVNAAQALPVGHAEANTIRVVTYVYDDSRVAVEVIDTGKGIPPQVLERIFDPFFTTKPVGEGTGLGLSICQSIVNTLGGEIEVESVPERGTTLRVILPIAPESTIVSKTAARPQHYRVVTRASILVVDDEPNVLNMIRRLLRGHELTMAASGREALDRLEQNSYDVVLCDVMMPDISGPELFARVKESHPALVERVIFMTGGAFTANAQQFLASVDNHIIYKPFDSKKLREVVRTVVAQKSRR